MAVEIIVGIVIILMAVVITVAVLLQSSKEDQLSGAIAGGNDNTPFGRAKGRMIDKKLNKATIILSIAFMVIIIVAYVVFKVGVGKVRYDDSALDSNKPADEVVTTVADGTTADPETTTAADTSAADETPETDD